MTSLLIDRFARLAASAVPRRAVAAGLITATIGACLASEPAVAMARPRAAAKKRRRRCPAARRCSGRCCAKQERCVSGACERTCQFDKSGTTWTLAADCTTNKAIEIPAGTRFLGDNKTITLGGPARSFKGKGAIVVTPGAGATQIAGVKIDGGELTGECENAMVSGIVVENGDLQFSGSIIRGLACGRAISVVNRGRSTRDVAITGSTINNSAADSLDDPGAILLDGNLAVQFTGTTVTGPGPKGAGSTGLRFRNGAGGLISGSTISGFADDNAGFNSCGIQAEADAGDVTLDGQSNSLSANENHICGLD